MPHDTTAIRRIINKYVYMLRQLPPDVPSLDKIAEAILDAYKSELVGVGVNMEQLQRLAAFDFLLFEASFQAEEPTNTKALSEILLNHLRVDYYMRYYLRLQLSTRPPEETDIDRATYADCWTLSKKYMGTKTGMGLSFFNGLKEIDSVKLKFANCLSYKLNLNDLTAMIEFMDNYFTGPISDNRNNPLSIYCSFCGYSCDHFRGSTWALQNLIRKIAGKQLQEPNWYDFATRFSVHSSEKL